MNRCAPAAASRVCLGDETRRALHHYCSFVTKLRHFFRRRGRNGAFFRRLFPPLMVNNSSNRSVKIHKLEHELRTAGGAPRSYTGGLARYYSLAMQCKL